MPHSFGCEATDWLRGINFGLPVKDLALAVSVVIFEGASVVTGVGASTIQ